MALNLFPVRAAIGQARGADGRTLDVFMTPEFARALGDVFAKLDGAGGGSADEAIALAASDSSVSQVLSLLAQMEALRALFELAAPVVAMFQQIEALQAELALIESPAAQVRYIQTHYATKEYVQNAVDAKQDKIDPVTVTGSRGGNIALDSLLTGLASQGLIINDTTE